jgi:uncharacterized protein
VLTAKSREPAKTKAEGTPDGTKPKVDAAQQVQVNPLWSRLATRVQPKLVVTAPDDPYEREADQAADQVMRMPEPRVQRKCAACAAGGSGRPKIQEVKRAAIQPQNAECKAEEKQPIQTQGAPAEHAEPVLDAGVGVRAAEHGGEPIPSTLRSYFEPRFGYDLSGVRVHADGEAAVGALALRARAYTLGRDIVFGAAEYAPATAAGKRLLAHELAHVIQQTGAASPLTQGAPAVQRLVPKDAGEQMWPDSGFIQSDEQRGISPVTDTLPEKQGALPDNPGVLVTAGPGGMKTLARQPTPTPAPAPTPTPTPTPTPAPAPTPGTVDDLTNAITNHDQGKVQQLINSGVDVNALDTSGMSPLTQAAKDNDLQIMDLLINSGAQVDGQNHDHETALIVVAHSGNKQAAQLLLQNGAFVNAQDLQHRSPLFLSVEQGNLGMVNFFLGNLADPDFAADMGVTCLMVAASQGNEAIMKALIAAGAKVNKQDRNDRTALMEAALAGHAKSVKLLLSHFADPNKVDKFGQTALIEAGRSGNAEIAEALLKAKADVNLQDQDGKTALMRAANQGNVDFVKVLVGDRKTDVNLKDSKGATALIEAAKSGNAKTLKAVLQSKNKVDLDVQDKNNRTALMEAVASRSADMAKALIQGRSKPKLDLQDSEGKTALILAVETGIVESVRALVKAGAKRNITDNQGDTALSAAKDLLKGTFSMQAEFETIIKILQ